MMIALALLFATQSAMTFSRGGLYSAGGAVIAGSWYLLRDPRARMLLILAAGRSEEHTSELQSQSNLVCRLLLEKKKKKQRTTRDQRHKDKDPTLTSSMLSRRIPRAIASVETRQFKAPARADACSRPCNGAEYVT